MKFILALVAFIGIASAVVVVNDYDSSAFDSEIAIVQPDWWANAVKYAAGTDIGFGDVTLSPMAIDVSALDDEEVVMFNVTVDLSEEEDSDYEIRYISFSWAAADYEDGDDVENPDGVGCDMFSYWTDDIEDVPTTVFSCWADAELADELMYNGDWSLIVVVQAYEMTEEYTTTFYLDSGLDITVTTGEDMPSFTKPQCDDAEYEQTFEQQDFAWTVEFEGCDEEVIGGGFQFFHADFPMLAEFGSCTVDGSADCSSIYFNWVGEYNGLVYYYTENGALEANGWAIYGIEATVDTDYDDTTAPECTAAAIELVDDDEGFEVTVTCTDDMATYLDVYIYTSQEDEAGDLYSYTYDCYWDTADDYLCLDDGSTTLAMGEADVYAISAEDDDYNVGVYTDGVDEAFILDGFWLEFLAANPASMAAPSLVTLLAVFAAVLLR